MLLDSGQLQQIIDAIHQAGFAVVGVGLSIVFAVTWKG